MLEIQRLHSTNHDFDRAFQRLVSKSLQDGEAVAASVRDILAAVRERGDTAVLEYTRRYDQREASSLKELEVKPADLQAALEDLDAADRQALETAAERLRVYARRQKQASWEIEDEYGSRVGQRITPLERVGVYVPGGKAAYPSSVLMNVIPAKVAGVGEVIMVSPAPKGELNPLVAAAAALAGVDRLFTIGGAQAIGALAYGTETVPAVDKIVGPGNAYVAAAKRQVYGIVGIDMIAGPSEVVVIGDGSVDPDWIAMDLFSQAEHDEEAQAILLSPDPHYLDRVGERMTALLGELPRREIIEAAIHNRGAFIEVRDLDEAAALVNRIAPEHLKLAVADPEALLDKVRHAGAIFLGAYSPEAFGDYCAGPNHVLPTAHTARFSSPLGVYDFQKRSSVIRISPQGARALGPVAARLARGEGLDAHARSAEFRCKGDGQ